MRFQIEPYVGGLPIRFGYSESEVLSLLGEPEDSGRNFLGDRHFYYNHLTIGFQNQTGQVHHIAFNPGIEVTFHELNIFDKEAFLNICKLDGNPLEYVGNITLLKFGIYFYGFHGDAEGYEQKVVSIFTRAKLSEFDPKDMKPFQFVEGEKKGPGAN